MKAKKVSVTPRRRRLIIGVISALIIMCSSCQMKRVITNVSRYHQSGDTACVITTKTTEVYTLKKQDNYGNQSF